MFMTACYTDVATSSQRAFVVDTVEQIERLVRRVSSDPNAEYLSIAFHKDDSERSYYESNGNYEVYTDE